MQDIEDIVSSGNCAGCGLCLSVDAQRAPDRQLLEMRKTRSGHLRPRFKPGSGSPQQRAALSARVRQLCPGVEIPAPAVEPAMLVSDVWGSAYSLAEGYASDPVVRHKAASGGVLTAVTQYLVDSGAVEMVCHCSPNFQGDPLVDGPQASSDGEAVLQYAGSRYGPSAPLAQVMQLLDAGTVFALVGKPCDIGAMRRLALVDPRVDMQVPYMLSIFCEGPTDLVTVRKIAKKMGISSLAEVDKVQYRGNGCPGSTTISTKRGYEPSLTYTEAWFDKHIPWRMPWRCKTCADSIGLHADLVALDVWPDARPTSELPGSTYVDEGYNYIITRTERGERLLRKACGQASGRAVTLTDKVVDFDLIRKAQPQHVRKRTQAAAKSIAAVLLGVPTTHYPAELRTGRSAVALEGRTCVGVASDLVYAFCGAAQRLIAGKNCESLELWRENVDDAIDTTVENDAPVHAAGASLVCVRLSVAMLGLGSLYWALNLKHHSLKYI